MLLEGKNVLVTGGARGIGKEIIMKCLAEGASIHYCDLEEGPHKREMDAACIGDATVTFYSANITDEDQVKGLIKDITAAGSLDVVVNNAGITRDGMVFRMPLDQWESVLKVNLTGAFLVSQGSFSVHGVEAEIRQYRQHGVGGRSDGQCRPDQLFGVQGRTDRIHQESG
jgi:3-oxoacyl-[acyl-carrier protein] reductase